MLHKFLEIILFSYLKLNAKRKCGRGVKILTPKQIFQRLPIAGNTSKNLSNEIGQIMYSFYLAKEITKKVSNNIMNSIKL